VKLVVMAFLLAGLSVSLLGPVSAALSRAAWVERAPRAAVLLWQCVGLGAIFSGIGAGVALAVSHYRSGLAGGTRQLIDGIFSGHALQGQGIYDVLGLTLAADLLIVLCVVLGVVTMRTVRMRARHRKLLDLVTYEAPEFPGTEFLSDERAVAYCLPGLRPRIVLSDGTRELLGRDQLWAVIHHERGHAHEHHGLVMFPMLGLQKALGWMPYARYAPKSMTLLLEMAADDFSARRAGRYPLAAALVEMSSAGWSPSCGLGLTGSGVVSRVSRLTSRRPTSKGAAALALGLGVGALLVPLGAAALL
jgi:Zn-dependent protease with chaperone function